MAGFAPVPRPSIPAMNPVAPDISAGLVTGTDLDGDVTPKAVAARAQHLVDEALAMRDHTSGWVNITSKGASPGASGATNSAAVAAAIAASRRVYIPDGSYDFAEPITVRQGLALLGQSEAGTILNFPAAHGIYGLGTDAHDLRLGNFTLLGDGLGATKHGIFLDSASDYAWRNHIDDVYVGNFSGDGVRITRPLLLTLGQIHSHANGGSGFRLIGESTTVKAENCFGELNGAHGWHIGGTSGRLGDFYYCTFTSCSADANTGRGWFFEGTDTTAQNNVSLVSCGAEINGDDQFRFDGTLGLTIASCHVNPVNALGVTIGGHYFHLNGVRNAVLSGMRHEVEPAAGKYGLYLSHGVQYPTNIVGTGVKWPATRGVSNDNSPPAYSDVGAEGWNNFAMLNSWVDAGAGGTPGYSKCGSEVRLRGRIKSGGLWSSAGTLPAGYRPGSTQVFPVLSNDATFGAVMLNGSGDVVPIVGDTGTYIALDGISFRAEQ